MNIVESTSLYERWLTEQADIVRSDLRHKHQFMAEGTFPFLRGTYYRWLQLFPKLCKSLMNAPVILAIADHHIENFGTWRDTEGRLTWGVNDFDEASQLPYAQDLVRLATSAIIATDEGQIQLKPRTICDVILQGYGECLKSGGEPFVLAEKHRSLRDLAIQQLKDPQLFWNRLQQWPTVPKTRLPDDAKQALERSMGKPLPAYKVFARQAGFGSRGRHRFAAVYSLNGGLVSREAKALIPSAAAWRDQKNASRILYWEILQKSIRNPDWSFRIDGHWLVRRLAPDCTTIRLVDFPTKRNEERILHGMGWETGNIHLGSPKMLPAILSDLKKRKANWLFDSAKEMANAVRKDWKVWRSNFVG